jgi:hydroxypyruvate isomerase
MPAPRYAVNCSIMLKDRPVASRLDAVRDAGVEAVEFWWPFATPTPTDAEVDTFVETIRASGLQLIGLNLYAGDMPGGDRGVVSWPDHTEALRANVEIVRHIGESLGCRAFNALYANRRPAPPAAEQHATAIRNLGYVAEQLAAIGGTVLVEPVSGAEQYPLTSARDVVGVLDRVADETGATNLGLLLDVYHLAVNGDDVPGAIQQYRPRIAHVQVADMPGRGAPGTGDLPLRDWLADLLTGGYTGWIALEYVSDDPNPLAWLASTDASGPRTVGQSSNEGTTP